MKQRKVKKELVLTTYWDYLRHFGREEGRKKWREHKKRGPEKLLTVDEVIEKNIKNDPEFKKTYEEENKKLAKEYSGIASQSFEDLEPIQKAILGGANQDIRKTESDILECGTSIVELISKPVWQRWIKPQIQKDMVDFVMKATMTSGEVRDESMGGYKYSKKILKTIDKWIQDYTFIVKREEAKQNKGKGGK